MSRELQDLLDSIWQGFDRVRNYSAHSLPTLLTQFLGVLTLRLILEKGLPAPRDSRGSQPLDPTLWRELLASQFPERTLVRVITVIRSHPTYSAYSEILDSLGLGDLQGASRDFHILAQSIDQLPIDSSIGGAPVLDIVFDAILAKLADVGIAGQEHVTLPRLSHLLVRIAGPESSDDIYDPACGTGGTLAAALEAVRQGANLPGPRVYGTEVNATVAALAKLNLAVHGQPPNQVNVGNGLTQKHPHLVRRPADLVISAPPFGLKMRQHELDQLIYHHDLPYPARDAQLNFWQVGLAATHGHGRAVFLCNRLPLISAGVAERIRSSFLDRDLVEAVVELPPNLLPGTSVSVFIISLNKRKQPARLGRVRFVRAESLALQSGGHAVSIEPLLEWLAGPTPDSGQGKVSGIEVSLGEIRRNQGRLDPSHYLFQQSEARFPLAERWLALGDIADVVQGAGQASKSVGPNALPIIQGRDLRVLGTAPDTLERGEISDEGKVVAVEAGDILIQRIGENPAAFLVEPQLKGALAAQTVIVVRPSDRFHHQARFLVDFLNSQPGQSILRSALGGSHIPTLSVRALRAARVPIAPPDVRELSEDLRELENAVNEQLRRAQRLRESLFEIDEKGDSEQLISEMTVETASLAHAVSSAGELLYQIRNLFPQPLAFQFSALKAIPDPHYLYQQQLAVAETVLAFIGSLGLAALYFSDRRSADLSDPIRENSLRVALRRGISPGHWLSISHGVAQVFREQPSTGFEQEFSALWLRSRSGRPRLSRIHDLLASTVELKNDFKHDRGPSNRQEFETACQELQRKLAEIFEQLRFLIKYRFMLVTKSNRTWEGDYDGEALVYAGDSPGLEQRRFRSKEGLSPDQFYLDLTDGDYLPLYPLITAGPTHMGHTPIAHTLDRWDAKRRKAARVRPLQLVQRNNRKVEASGDCTRHLDLWLEKYGRKLAL